MAAVDYVSKGQPDGQENNMGGTKQVIYFAPIADFAIIGAPVASPTTEAGVVEITTAHTFKTGKCFKELYCTLDKGEVNFETQGDRDGRSFMQKAKIFYPGAKKEAIGFASLVKNDRFIVIIPLADGTKVQIGSADFYAEILPKFGSGTNSGGVRGHEFEISSMNSVNLVYNATVNLTPAP
jgi:hypothetical protein